MAPITGWARTYRHQRLMVRGQVRGQRFDLIHSVCESTIRPWRCMMRTCRSSSGTWSRYFDAPRPGSPPSTGRPWSASPARARVADAALASAAVLLPLVLRRREPPLRTSVSRRIPRTARPTPAAARRTGGGSWSGTSSLSGSPPRSRQLGLLPGTVARWGCLSSTLAERGRFSLRCPPKKLLIAPRELLRLAELHRQVQLRLALEDRISRVSARFFDELGTVLGRSIAACRRTSTALFSSGEEHALPAQSTACL